MPMTAQPGGGLRAGGVGGPQDIQALISQMEAQLSKGGAGGVGLSPRSAPSVAGGVSTMGDGAGGAMTTGLWDRSAAGVPKWMQAQGIATLDDPRAQAFIKANPMSELAQRANPGGGGATGFDQVGRLDQAPVLKKFLSGEPLGAGISNKQVQVDGASVTPAASGTPMAPADAGGPQVGATSPSGPSVSPIGPSGGANLSVSPAANSDTMFQPKAVTGGGLMAPGAGAGAGAGGGQTPPIAAIPQQPQSMQPVQPQQPQQPTMQPTQPTQPQRQQGGRAGIVNRHMALLKKRGRPSY